MGERFYRCTPGSSDATYEGNFQPRISTRSPIASGNEDDFDRITRAQIEQARDDLIAYEGGTRFQSLGVILAKQKCNKLVAHVKKADLGLDAYASLTEFGDGRGRVPSAPSLTKVKVHARVICKGVVWEFAGFGGIGGNVLEPELGWR